MKREIQAVLSHFSANRECLLHSGGSGFARTNQDKTMNFAPYYESYTGIGETPSHWLHLLDTECVYMHNYADRVVIKYWINMQIVNVRKCSDQTKFFQIGYCPLVLILFNKHKSSYFSLLQTHTVWDSTCLIFVVCTSTTNIILWWEFNCFIGVQKQPVIFRVFYFYFLSFFSNGLQAKNGCVVWIAQLWIFSLGPHEVGYFEKFNLHFTLDLWWKINL